MTFEELSAHCVLKPEVAAIAAAAESVGGKPIDFRIDNALDAPARTSIATARMPASIVTLNMTREDRVDHAIARECAHIGRVLSAPPGDRVVATTRAAARAIARTQLSPEAAFVNPSEREARLAEWIDAFVRRLTTLPARMRVESSLYWDHPGLHEDQARALGEEAQELLREMEPEAAAVPPSLFRMSAMLTFAYLRTIGPFAGRKYTSGTAFSRVAISMGEQLVRLAEVRDRGLPGDVAVADAWADALGVRNWYEWVPY
jgi:hypothetical protein